MKNLSASASNDGVIFENVEDFLRELNNLEKKGYFFRGVENRSFSAQPSAFRHHVIEKNKKNFPTPYEVVSTEWFYHPDNIATIQLLHGGISLHEIKRHQGIHRLFKLIAYLQICNYFFTKHKEDNPKHVFPKDKQEMENRDTDFWADQETFNYFIVDYFRKMLTRESFDKSSRQDGTIDNTFTVIDESFPQHYGVSTSGLDFTKRNLVAIFFAIESHLEVKFNNEVGLYIAKKEINHGGVLSIYAIKLIEDTHESPIRIEEIDQAIPNPRAINQQGVLCYISDPCHYYMQYELFPTIENYLVNGKNKHLIFKKLSLKRSIKNLDFLSGELLQGGITRDFIYPD